VALRPEVVIAAFLRTLELPMEQIAQIMPVKASQPSVSRWLSEAQKSGILYQTWRLEVPRDVLLGALHGLRNVPAEEDIARRWALDNCIVLATRGLTAGVGRGDRRTGASGDREARGARDLVLAALGRAAAILFVSELAPRLAVPAGGDPPETRVAATSWGRTCEAFCSALESTRSTAPGGGTLPDLLVVPAIGHVTGTVGAQPHWRFSAQGVAQAFAHAVGSDRDPLTVAVPARLPPMPQDDERRYELAHEILASDAGYRELFIGEAAWAHQLDFAVLSVGPLGWTAWWPEESWWQPLADDEDLASPDYMHRLSEEGVVGEILWRFVQVVGDRTQEARGKIGQVLNRSLVALEIAHLRALADKARNQQAAGTLFIAESEAKGAICRAALDMGLVNHLVIDDALAEALVGPRARR